jgi:PAS domain S-box-containing protein
MNEIRFDVNECRWAIDARLRLTYANGPFTRRLGLTREEILPSADPFAVLHEDDRARAAALLEQAAQTRRNWSGEVLRFVTHCGAVRLFETHGSAIFDSQGRLLGFAGVDRDVTEAASVSTSGHIDAGR